MRTAILSVFVLPHWWRARLCRLLRNSMWTQKLNLFVTCLFLRMCVIKLTRPNTNSKKTKKKTQHQQQLPCKKGHKLVFPPNHLHQLDRADGAVSSSYVTRALAYTHNFNFIFIFQIQIFIVVKCLWQQNEGKNWRRRWHQQKHTNRLCYLPVR